MILTLNLEDKQFLRRKLGHSDSLSGAQSKWKIRVMGQDEWNPLCLFQARKEEDQLHGKLSLLCDQQVPMYHCHKASERDLIPNENRNWMRILNINCFPLRHRGYPWGKGYICLRHPVVPWILWVVITAYLPLSHRSLLWAIPINTQLFSSSVLVFNILKLRNAGMDAWRVKDSPSWCFPGIGQTIAMFMFPSWNERVCSQTFCSRT